MFPGCRQISQRAALPIRGQALRHSYSTVAADLKIDDLIRHFLMGHAPKGISQDYVALSDFAERPGDARGAGADFEAHSRTSRAYARRP